MISQGKVIGVLEVLNKIKGDFSHNDEDLLKSIASSVSIAIENARLYKETVSMAEHERGIRSMFQKFVPKEIVDKIVYGTETGGEMLEEVKTLTLLNIDIREFSRISREIGSQKTVPLLNYFFSVMGGIVFKHHGIVDKYLGDGLLALFGAPVSSIMDADNAAQAALEMKNLIATVNEYYAREFGVSVSIGISIHTGEVVVGGFGFEMKMDYTVIGDPVNDVFKLQELTKSIPNSILISEKTCHSARSRLELRDIDVKLRDIKIYELLGYNLGD
jgi:class 3 adenylate cyclase